MKQENKEAKSFESIRKHKTGFSFLAVIALIVIVVSVGIHSRKPIERSSHPQVGSPAVAANINTTTSKPQSDSESKASTAAASSNSVKSDLEADTWYVYNALDLLKFQNCVVVNASSVGSKAIIAQYFSVCKECHMIELNGEGLPRSAAPELNYPFQKMYHCGECGETTVVRLEIKQ